MPELPESPITVDVKAPKGRASLEEVLVLRERGFSLKECGKQLGKSKQAISQMLKRSGLGVDVETVEQFKKDKPLILNAKQKVLLDALTPKVVAKMSGRDLLVGAGIIQDKLRDLENPAHGGINATLWVNIVTAAQRPEKDVTPVEVTE